MASINGVSLPYAGGATNSANLRTPAEENTNKTAIQSVTAPQAGSRSVVGAANDLSATQTISSLLDVRSSSTNSALNSPPPPPPPQSSANQGATSNQAGLSTTEPVQQTTVNAVESQLQAARLNQQQSTSQSSQLSQNVSNGPTNQTTAPLQADSSTTNSQKAYITSQTAEKGLGLSIDTRS
jgi:hypothetical protein